MKLGFFGSPEFALPSLKALHESKHKITAVVTQPDKPKGRRRQVLPTPVKQYAVQKGLNVLAPNDLTADEFRKVYQALGTDINIVVAYGKLLPSWLIDYPPHKTLNAHASLLPKYRGAAPIRRALMAGDKKTGVTILQVVEKMDAGDIALQKSLLITEDDNNQSLSIKLADLAAWMLPEALDLIEKGKLPKIRQEETEASYASKISKEEQKIDFSKPAQELFNKVRALAPKPGTWALFRKKRLKVLKAALGQAAGSPGEVIEVDKEGILIGTKDETLLLQTVQPEGGRIMDAFEYAKGHQIKKGIMFNEDDR